MHDSTLQAYVRAVPFQPFRIVVNGGKSYDVFHPELIRVGRDSFIYYYATPPDAPYDTWETVSLLLSRNVEHIHQPAPQTTQGN